MLLAAWATNPQIVFACTRPSDAKEAKRHSHTYIYMKKCRCIIFQSWHRVDRALSFFSSRPNWDYPTPSHAGDVYPFFGSGGRGGVAGEGVGESEFRRGKDTVVYSRYICTI
jgi:hypothetical protein